MVRRRPPEAKIARSTRAVIAFLRYPLLLRSRLEATRQRTTVFTFTHTASLALSARTLTSYERGIALPLFRKSTRSGNSCLVCQKDLFVACTLPYSVTATTYTRLFADMRKVQFPRTDPETLISELTAHATRLSDLPQTPDVLG